MLKNLAGVAIAAACIVAPLATAPSAQAEPTGQYYYRCIAANGLDYFLKPGEPLKNCKGSYLQTYINGKMVKSVSLTPGGSVAKKLTAAQRADCIVALAGTAVLIASPPEGWVWVASAAIAGYGLKACVA